MFCSCSFVVPRVCSCPFMFVRVHSCSLVFVRVYSYSFVFVRVPFVYIRVHLCSFVLVRVPFVFVHVYSCSIRVPSCSVRSSIYSFIYSFIRSSIHSSIHSFVHSFSQSVSLILRRSVKSERIGPSENQAISQSVSPLYNQSSIYSSRFCSSSGIRANSQDFKPKFNNRFLLDAVYNPCNNYQGLSEDNRAAGYNTLTTKSDKSSYCKKEWYRFTGDAGDKIASM